MSFQIKHQTDARQAANDAGRRANVVLQWLETAMRKWQRRKTITALHALDDWTLFDIGIPRRNIESIVNAREGRRVSPATSSHAADTAQADLRRAA